MNRTARRKPRWSALSLACAIVLGSCGGTDTAARPAPIEFSATDLRSGAAVELSSLRGQVVLLSGWATWCVPCRTELPLLDQLRSDRHAEGLEVVAVNIDAAGPSTREILPVLEELDVEMPAWRDEKSAFGPTFGAVSVPSNVLVGRDGKVVHRWDGAIDTDDTAVTRWIQGALASS